MTTSRELLGNRVSDEDITGPASLTAQLQVAETEAADALDEHRREAAATAGRLAAARAAAAELHTAGAECPVCRRELSADIVAHAEQTHSQDIDELSRRERELGTLIESLTKRVSYLRDLARRAARLPTLESMPHEPTTDIESAAVAVRQAKEEVDRLIDEVADARARQRVLATQIAAEEQGARETHEADLAYRREAVASTAAELMRETANAILKQQIDPLTTEIAHRWKKVFGERGLLRLRPNGHLVLVQGIHEIPFAQFSSGEKVVALLAMRLLILDVSTKASFLWLDEPLEHLDPKNRRITASLMTAAGHHVRQIVVTTYEEALARRLASASHARVRYVRASNG